MACIMNENGFGKKIDIWHLKRNITINDGVCYRTYIYEIKMISSQVDGI